ncbi:helix-turn-helix domain-containing protein [Brevibacillus ginsengisoli]|uniref:helix-turn-helix domain-containing protein n=1 Tax=Brevibacillus ginsengisoli TaxID=363854 RepID=UPI003CF50D7E
MNYIERNQWIDKTDLHLRTISRQLVKFDTLDETLHCLIESFWDRFECDYVSIILKTKDVLDLKVSKGFGQSFEEKFPMDQTACSDRFFKLSNCCKDEFAEEDTCDFLNDLQSEGFATWFTVPIKESASNSLGICAIGFRHEVPLIRNADKLFEEFGKDIAVAIGMALSKENEKKKINGMEWLKENVFLGSSIEQLIGNITERAGKGTHAGSASIYLYDEVQNCFIYQAPSFGDRLSVARINIGENDHLCHYFPHLEREGGSEITIPLIVNLKTIGVLHVKKGNERTFTKEDVDLLQFLSSHVSVLIENARLYKAEMEDKVRLEKLMVHHQELVKQTLVGEGFLEITKSLSHMLGRAVVLFDRFLRPISCSLGSMELLAPMFEQLDREKWKIANPNSQEQWIKDEQKNEFGIWQVVGGGDLLGYLGLRINRKEIDMVVRMTLNHALNVYAIQFIKQKLILDMREQVKDGFIHQLFVEKIEDKEKLIEYANLFNLNIFQPNKIGVFSIVSSEKISVEEDLLTLEAKKTWLWEKIREDLLQFDQGIIVTKKEGLYVLIVSEKKEQEAPNYWGIIYNRMKRILSTDMQGIDIFLGISAATQSVEDYYICYRQALQALKIVSGRFSNKKFLSFENLGSYSVLSELQETFTAKMFFKNHLEPLLNYGNGKGKELFDTLRVYLMMNGNLKDTAEHLYIHRSSLKYRLEKISSLLSVNIEDAEERFNLMLAYKLYDLFVLQD